MRTLLPKSLVILGLALCAASWRGGAAQTPDPGPNPPPDAAALSAMPIQEMVSRADSVLRLPAGLLTGSLSFVLKDGRSAQWDFTLHRREREGEAEMVYQFSSRRRGLEAKLLFRGDGEEIWFWDARRNALSRRRDFEKYDRLFGTGFSYIDLSGYPLQDNYSGREARRFRPAADSELNALREAGRPPAAPAPAIAELLRITVSPIFESRYRRMVIICDPVAQFRPLRADYFDLDDVLFKTMHFHYDAQVLNKATERSEAPLMPGMTEALDLDNGSISRLEFYTIDSRVSPADALFDPDFLNR